MDIRDFFAAKKKGSSGSDKKKNNNENPKKRKSSSTSAKNSSGRSRRSNPKLSSKMLSPIDEDMPKQKKKQVLSIDSDSDATTDMNDSKHSATTTKKSSSSSSPPKKQQRQEISANDFFASTSSPAAKKKTPSSVKPSRRKNLTEPIEEILSSDDDSIDLDQELPVSSKKRSSPNVSKTPPKKPVRKASPASKRFKFEDGSDDDDDDDDDDKDDDFVMSDKEADESDDEMDQLLPVKRTPTKKSPKRHDNITTSPATTDSSKKRKTTPASTASSPRKGKKSPVPEKEPPLEPTLELSSFDTDQAAPECLHDHTFVFTGVLEGWSRDDASDFVKILGGRVTTGVSGKTTYLVVGETLEDGRPYHEGKKYQKAIELGTHIVMGQKKLYGLAKLYSDKARKNDSQEMTSGQENNTSPPVAAAAAAAAQKPVTNNPYAKPTSNPYAKKVISNPYAKNAVNNPYAKSNVTMVKAPATAAPVTIEHGTNALWVDKHAPTNTQFVLGNKDIVTKLSAWLSRWESRFNNDQAVGKVFSNPQGPWKAALLSGPPGIGKTTTATLVAMEAGRDLLEFNASDVRSKKSMKEGMGDITGSQSVQGYFGVKGGKAPDANVANHKKRCIIMDEVDGMGGGDRGGMAELIQMIKHSRVPIICICNDRQSQKMKSLLPYCLDLRFRRPVKGQIAKAAMRIAEKEGLRVEQNAAEAMAESCGNDIRQVLNALQMWASNSSNNDTNALTYKGLKDRQSSINKDEILRVSLFDAARTLLEGRRGLSEASPDDERSHFFKRNDAFFVDYSFTGLLVQQNYLKVSAPRFNEAKRSGDSDKQLAVLEETHAAAMSMSDYTMVENCIRGGSDMNWGLLPFSGVLAVKTGFHCAGPTGSGFPGFPEFTTWLGRNSSRGKKTRIMQELNHHMNYKVSGGTQEVRLSYVPFLRQRFLSQLKFSKDEDRNAVAIQLMDDYGLDRDDVFENLDEFTMDPKGPKIADIDSKSKSAFTREYNKGSHKSQALVEEQGAPKKTKKGSGNAAVDPDDPDAIDDDAVESEEEDQEEDLEQLKAAFKKKGRKAAAKQPAKGKGKGNKK